MKYGKDKRMKKMDGGIAKKKMMGGGKIKRAAYKHGGKAMEKAKPC